MRDGLKKLRLALITASEILTPHLNAVETGRDNKTHLSQRDSLRKNNMKMFVIGSRDLSARD